MENWIQTLMESVFKKVDKQSIELTTSGKSKYLSQIIEERYGFLLSDRNISRYYTGYITGETKKIKPNKATLNILSLYLGYHSFEDFVRKNETREDMSLRKFTDKIRNLHIKVWISFGINVILCCTLLFCISRYYRKNCMVWMNDHYEKIRCSGLEYETILNEDVLRKFKKNPDHR